MQNSGSLRDKLHHYIDVEGEQKIKAIYVLLEGDIEKGHIYSKEEIEMFYERRGQHLVEEGKTYSVEESIGLIRQSLKD
ncbi:MAG: hypothetical protein ACXVNO_03080 [Bacteroidia bacterium]